MCSQSNGIVVVVIVIFSVHMCVCMHRCWAASIFYPLSILAGPHVLLICTLFKVPWDEWTQKHSF